MVTGATGLVGSWLLLELSKREMPLRAMKRADSSTEGVRKLFEEFSDMAHFEKIEWIEADLLNLPRLSKAVENVGTIYHTAAFVSFDSRCKNKIFETNISGTENLVNTAISQSTSNLILVSSISTLDNEEGKAQIDENSKWNSELTHSYYAISKRRSEMEFFRAGEEAGINVLIVNPSIVIGSLNANRPSESLFKIASKKETYATNGITGFVDVRDVAFCVAELTQRELWGQRFILNAGERSFVEVFDFLKKDQKKGSIKLLSNSKLKLLKNLSKIGSLFGGRLIDDASFVALCGKSVYSNQKIREVLDYEFIPIEESLAFHLKRYLSNKIDLIK